MQSRPKLSCLSCQRTGAAADFMGCSRLSFVKLSTNGTNVCELAFVPGRTFRTLHFTFGFLPFIYKVDRQTVVVVVTVVISNIGASSADFDELVYCISYCSYTINLMEFVVRSY